VTQRGFTIKRLRHLLVRPHTFWRHDRLDRSWEKLSDGTQARIRTILLFGVVIGFVIGVLAASLWVRFA
jgi:hypothetical protein